MEIQQDASIQTGSKSSTIGAAKKQLKSRQDDGWGGKGMVMPLFCFMSMYLEEEVQAVHSHHRKPHIRKDLASM